MKRIYDFGVGCIAFRNCISLHHTMLHKRIVYARAVRSILSLRFFSTSSSSTHSLTLLFVASQLLALCVAQCSRYIFFTLSLSFGVWTTHKNIFVPFSISTICFNLRELYFFALTCNGNFFFRLFLLLLLDVVDAAAVVFFYSPKNCSLYPQIYLLQMIIYVEHVYCLTNNKSKKYVHTAFGW